ncbi:MAG: 3-deoxy-D-manno-octulosonic acid transferase [Nitrospinae bacterium]|nr:3-deoxy-D-manno-octulosonic acid transferase [Nitrospinota bacterium]
MPFLFLVLYNLILILALPLLAPYLAWRLFSGKETKESLLCKLGFYGKNPAPEGVIWIHAVSVGEVNTAAPLAELLEEREKKPIVFSVSTQTGMETAKARLGGKVHLTWFPLDFPFAVSRALARFSPSAVVFLETELWPNFILAAKKSGIKCAVANGRISDKSFANYKTTGHLIGPVLRQVSLFMMQSADDAERISKMGADAGRIAVTGNIKFDRPAPARTSKESAMKIFKIPAGAKTVVFASTHPGEDEIFLQTAKNISSAETGFFFVIAPRHVTRSKDVAALCEKFGFAPATRSSGMECEKYSVLVLDTMGELAKLYEAVDVAVMGGSFVPHGGQNPLEASAWGAPVLFGPHMENFREISQKLLEAGAGKLAADGAELEKLLLEWLANEDSARFAGEQGIKTVENNRGALEKTVRLLDQLLKNG